MNWLRQNRALTSILLIAAIVCGLACGTFASHHGIDFDKPVAAAPIVPAIKARRSADLTAPSIGSIAAPHLPSAPDRAPPLV